MLKERAERVEFLHRAGQLGKVFQTPGGFGGAIILPHRRVTGLVQYEPGEFGVRELVGHVPPAGNIAHQIAERLFRPRRQFIQRQPKPLLTLCPQKIRLDQHATK